jgi:hypothetical protein
VEAVEKRLPESGTKQYSQAGSSARLYIDSMLLRSISARLRSLPEERNGSLSFAPKRTYICAPNPTIAPSLAFQKKAKQGPKRIAKKPSDAKRDAHLVFQRSQPPRFSGRALWAAQTYPTIWLNRSSAPNA